MSVPEMGKRYYLMQIMDDWTNVFAAPGTRTTGGGKGRLRHRRPAMEREAARGCQGTQVPDEHGLDLRSHADRPARRITRRSTPSRTSTS